ncbi:hypothetical protein Tco_0033915 [Tanacetum coccineum]
MKYGLEDNATDFQRVETYDGQSSPVDNHPGGETEAENSLETPVDQVEVQGGGTDNKDQYVPRRTHQNQRGGGRNGGGRGNGRGYGSGRGGRSGGRGGPYQNGRNQYNDQQGNYYPRNHGGREERRVMVASRLVLPQLMLLVVAEKLQSLDLLVVSLVSTEYASLSVDFAGYVVFVGLFIAAVDRRTNELTGKHKEVLISLYDWHQIELIRVMFLQVK